MAAPAGGGPGSARRTGLRPAAALSATSPRLQLLRSRHGPDRSGEGQDDGVVVRHSCGRGESRSGGGGHVHGMAGKAAQGRRGGQAGGEGSECGGGMAGAHACLIGSPGVRRNFQHPAHDSAQGLLPRPGRSMTWPSPQGVRNWSVNGQQLPAPLNCITPAQQSDPGKLDGRQSSGDNPRRTGRLVRRPPGQSSRARSERMTSSGGRGAGSWQWSRKTWPIGAKSPRPGHCSGCHRPDRMSDLAHWK